MLHRFLLVSSKDGVAPVKDANPQVSILPPGDGGWVVIDAGKVEELGNGWYRAELGNWSGAERLIVTASAAGSLEWRDLVDLDRASLVTAANNVNKAAGTSREAAEMVQSAVSAAKEAANAAKSAQETASAAHVAATAAQSSATGILQEATKTTGDANKTLQEATTLLEEIKRIDKGDGPSARPEIVARKPSAWNFHDLGNAFSRKNVGDSVELTCNSTPSQPVQLYDFGYALAAGRYQLVVEAEGKAGARFRFEVLQHVSPYYGLGKSSELQIGGSANQEDLSLKNDNNARLRLWFTGLAKPGDRYLIKKISLKKV